MTDWYRLVHLKITQHANQLTIAEMSQYSLKLEEKMITKKVLKCKDLINLQQDRWYSGMSITDVAHKIDSTYREMEEDLRVMIDTWHRYIQLMADTKEPQTEIN